jgi:hypothetical protein
MAAEWAADAGDGVGAGAMLLMLVIGVAAGMMVQRFNRSRRDLKGAKAFVKTAQKAHWRGSVPRMLVWAFVAMCALVAVVRSVG